ncbi:hypothetical protein A2U01_0107004, partial [Trifolium medium]|nr:hypothetical protein [Trifolium medium]
MWRLPLLWSWSIDLIVSLELSRTPPTSGIRAVVRLGGGAGGDPG